jgi:hypothetical protein
VIEAAVAAEYLQRRLSAAEIGKMLSRAPDRSFLNLYQPA